MQTALDTVNDYITDARVLLQDQVSPYRYDDNSLVTALNLTLLVARSLRADLFVGSHHHRHRHSLRPQQFIANDDTEVHIEPQFRQAIEYGLCAHAMLRDQEDIQDARATQFYGLFTYLLTGMAMQFTGKPPG